MNTKNLFVGLALTTIAACQSQPDPLVAEARFKEKLGRLNGWLEATVNPSESTTIYQATRLVNGKLCRFTLGNSVDFPQMAFARCEADHSLQVTCDRRGTLSIITTHPKFSEQETNQLLAYLREFIGVVRQVDPK